MKRPQRVQSVWRRVAAFLVVLVLAQGCSRVGHVPSLITNVDHALKVTAVPTPTATPASSPDYWPTSGWRTSTPEAQGMDSQALADTYDNILKQHIHLHSLLVIRHGYIVSEAYFYPDQPTTKHEQWSVTKGVMSAVVGIAIGKGLLRLDQPVLASLPDYSFDNVDAQKKAITLKNLLTMTTGLAWNESSAPYGSPANDETQMMLSQDWVKFVLDRPMAEEPGAKFSYNSGAAHLMSAMVQKATGMTTLAFAEANLFEPLGITDVKWPSDPQGITEGHVDLWLAPRDMAKIGYLYLRDGTWDGRQILPSGWVQESIETRAAGDPVFGYQWRRTSFGGYEAVGWGSQLIGFSPSQDLVVVVTGGVAPGEPGTEESIFKAITEQAIKSDSPLPPNPEGTSHLAGLVAEASQPSPTAVTAPPAIAQHVSGKTYQLANTPDGIQSFSLTFGDQDATLDLTVGTQRQRLAVGLDNVYRITDTPAGATAARGHWDNEKTFVVETQVLGAADTTQYTLTFTGDQVHGQLTAHVRDHKVEFDGQALD